MRGIRIGTLSKLLGKIDGGNYNQVVDPMTKNILSYVADSTMLWHRQLGNISEKGLRAMHNKGMVKGLPYC